MPFPPLNHYYSFPANLTPIHFPLHSQPHSNTILPPLNNLSHHSYINLPSPQINPLQRFNTHCYNILPLDSFSYKIVPALNKLHPQSYTLLPPASPTLLILPRHSYIILPPGSPFLTSSDPLQTNYPLTLTSNQPTWQP